MRGAEITPALDVASGWAKIGAMHDIELAAILCTRICHDLVGPVGALNNGVEVLAEEDDAEMQRQAVELLGHSAEQASRRLWPAPKVCTTS
jgi:hypothetical protein